MNELLDSEQLAAFTAKAAAGPHPRELVIDVLLAIQQHHGWVPDAGIELTADILGLPVIEVEEVATFYDKIFRRPVGRHVIHLCDSICCWSRGGEALARYLEEKLGVNLGETTADGLFTLLPTCCLGACGEAPALMIGQETYGDLSEARIDEILEMKRRM